jgi:hypothetical protein
MHDTECLRVNPDNPASIYNYPPGKTGLDGGDS